MDTRIRPQGFLDLSFLDSRKSLVIPTAKDFVIRASTVTDMLMCQGRKAIPAILNWPDFPPTEAMMFGSVTHGFIEDHEKGIKRPGMQIVVDVLAEDGFEIGDIAYPLPPLIHEAESAFHVWLRTIQPLYPDGTVEGRMHRPLGVVDGRPLWLRGTPDYYTGHNVVDWKTSSKKWQKGRENKSIQLPLYRSLIEWNHETMPWEGIYVIYSRAKQVWEERPVGLTEGKVNAAMLHAFTMGRALMKQEYSLSPFGEFSARAWYCSEKWCHAWDVCPAGGGEQNETPLLLPSPERQV